MFVCISTQQQYNLYMRTLAFSATDCGKVRKENEDFHGLLEDLGFFVVCDGLGGHSAGKVASELCVKTLLESATRRADVIAQEFKKVKCEVPFSEIKFQTLRQQVLKFLQESVREASKKIFEEGQANPVQRGMASTVAVLWVIDNVAFCANVGDTRIYLIRGTKIQRLTHDHRLRDELKTTTGKSSSVGNALTRAVGLHSAVQVDAISLDLAHEDTLILCTDGVTDYLNDLEIGEHSKRYAPIDLPKKFIEESNSRGGRDNITALVVRLEDPSRAKNAVDLIRRDEMVSRVKLFQHLSYYELTKVLEVCSVRAYERGAYLIRQGDFSNEMFLITYGKVDILKDGKKVAEREGGETIGEFGIFNNVSRTASAVCSVETKAVVVERRRFLELLRSDSQIGVKVLWALTQELSTKVTEISQEMLDSSNPVSIQASPPARSQNVVSGGEVHGTVEISELDVPFEFEK